MLQNVRLHLLNPKNTNSGPEKNKKAEESSGFKWGDEK
jgi:hypothetical protein